ncbi:substrate-binding domain-containing protein [Microbispora sp. ATCC PTA-5024]|uniref:substrate-binding domain-containing protein n=1 Tax=Microbispora sp. ATCC PTA-5024 TaxID=316330 RepID=UPI0003DD0146|nr:substrate-binding domain-containing protein [Microbispora sp. ATCC PTA-5024]ETK36089.1 ABC transporter substrate-binding protein [Microbispora sp. ATCC PTA-5024]
MGRRLAAGAVSLALVVAGCGPREESGDPLGAVGSLREGFAIGVLLPDTRTERYDAEDRPAILKAVRALCPRCRVAYRNAEGDPGRQSRQIDRLLDDGVRVLLLDPVDPATITSAVARAKMRGAKVVSYDRLANGPIDAYVSTDPEEMGRAQGRALIDAMRARGGRGPVALLYGPPGDSFAAALKKGVHAVVDGRVRVGWERDVPAGRAAGEARAAVAALGPAALGGVCCGGDAMSAPAAGPKPPGGNPRPRSGPDAAAILAASGAPLVGAGVDRETLRRIVLGSQTAAVGVDVAAQAAAAVRMAVEAARGRVVGGAARVSNGTTVAIPVVWVPPVVVTRANAAALLKD